MADLNPQQFGDPPPYRLTDIGRRTEGTWGEHASQTDEVEWQGEGRIGVVRRRSPRRDGNFLYDTYQKPFNNYAAKNRLSTHDSREDAVQALYDWHVENRSPGAV